MYTKIYKKIVSILLIFLLIIFFITSATYCKYDSYMWTIPDISINTSTNAIDSADNYEKSNNLDTMQTSSNELNTTSDNPLNLESGSAILVEQNSGEVLYEYNSHEQLRPASVTKIMTILLIMEALDSRKNKFNR